MLARTRLRKGLAAVGLPFIVLAVAEWGAASFENDPASDWFLLVEEAVEPGGVIASALDGAVGEWEYLGLDQSCEAIAAAELSASCAGHASARLPDNVSYWVDTHPHQPHDSEIDQAVHAVQRVRTESELRDYWDESVDGERWLREVDDLIARLTQSGGGDPATLSPWTPSRRPAFRPASSGKPLGPLLKGVPHIMRAPIPKRGRRAAPERPVKSEAASTA